MDNINDLVTNKQKLRRRENRVQQLIVPMQKQGFLYCEVCTGEKIPQFFSYKYLKTKIKVSIEMVCNNTRCTKSRGRSYQEEYDLVLSTEDVKEEKPIVRKERINVINKHVELYKKLISVKGIGNTLAKKLIDEGFNTKDLILDTRNETLLEVGGLTLKSIKSMKEALMFA